MKKLYWFIFVVILLQSCASKNAELLPPGKLDFCQSIHRNDSLTLQQVLATVDSMAAIKTGVYVMEEGDAALISRAWLCEYAQHTIDVQYFIFSTDNVGLIACDYLIRAADRGVKVRVLVDDLLVEAGSHELLTFASHPNIELKIYNPGVNLNKNIVQKMNAFRKDFRGANQRMHNKTFTVDGQVVITGGRNIADEYFDYDHEYNFRDRDVLLIGKAVAVVQNSFETFWNSSLSVPVSQIIQDSTVHASDPKRFDRLHAYACDTVNFWPQIRARINLIPSYFSYLQKSGAIQWCDSVRFYSDKPGKNDGKSGLAGGGVTTNTLANLLRQAKKEMVIQSPYLIVDEGMLKLFQATLKRGVRITILTNSMQSTDNPEAFNGYQRCRKALLEAGVQIYEYKPDAAIRKQRMNNQLQRKLDFTPIFGLHAKSMVVDSQLTIIGTFNLDPRSSNLNTECVTVINSTAVAASVLSGMHAELLPENAWHTTLQFNPDKEAGLLKRAKVASRRLVPQSIL